MPAAHTYFRLRTIAAFERQFPSYGFVERFADSYIRASFSCANIIFRHAFSISQYLMPRVACFVITACRLTHHAFDFSFLTLLWPFTKQSRLRGCWTFANIHYIYRPLQRRRPRSSSCNIEWPGLLILLAAASQSVDAALGLIAIITLESALICLLFGIAFAIERYRVDYY